MACRRRRHNGDRSRRPTLPVWLALFAFCFSPVAFPQATQLRREFRAVWVDTFNTTLNTHADIRRVVDGVRAARGNVILAQVRRRGDAWYLDSSEPPPDFTPIDRDFDPLADLIATAHTSGLQVHTFVIVGAIWNKDPALPPPANGLPQDSRHVFRRHGGFDPDRRLIVAGPENWLTRTLLADGAGISYQGHRIGSDFWLDFGHPAAAAYTVEVVADLVRRYDIDGLHLDRIRYPELTAPGQTPSTGANVGYNPVSVSRFLRAHQLPANSPPPSAGDVRWADWRRMQVTNLVRRIYLTVASIKPEVPLSAALIAFGGAPMSDQTWATAEAFWRVYQDWRAWLEEGIVDLAIPMVYKREHDAIQTRQFDDWLAWVTPRGYERCTMIGLGVFLNGVEGTLRQVRRSWGSGCGIALFSFANASEEVGVNPYSRPPGLPTPKRPFAELASALVTGRSVDGRIDYEDTTVRPVWIDDALPPVLSWKQAPLTGHLMGSVVGGDGSALDSAMVYIVDRRTNALHLTQTDGSGFFGAVDLDPGSYGVTVVAGGLWLRAYATVVAGEVAEVVVRPVRQP